MKRLFTILILLSFILVYGTIGAVDCEAATGITIISDSQFYKQIMISIIMLLSGTIGSHCCNQYKGMANLQMPIRYKNINNLKNKNQNQN